METVRTGDRRDVIARPARPAPSPRAKLGTGVTTRLIALFMLPVTVMCALAGSVVLSHRSIATRPATSITGWSS